MPDLQHREKFLIWLENEIPKWFGDRILPIDIAIAERWGKKQC